MINIPCVILSGGASRRMGEDKSLLPFKGFDTLIEYQYSKLSKLFSTVYISSKTDKFNFKANILIDQTQEIYSPMIALKSILSQIKSEQVFIVTVDVPFLQKETIYTLIENSINTEITIAKDNKHSHNLCGIYSKSLLNLINSFLDEDMHKINSLLKSAKNHKEILFQDEQQFININTRDDYNKYIL